MDTSPFARNQASTLAATTGRVLAATAEATVSTAKAAAKAVVVQPPNALRAWEGATEFSPVRAAVFTAMFALSCALERVGDMTLLRPVWTLCLDRGTPYIANVAFVGSE